MRKKKGLYANIHAKKKRIKAGSGEKMRKVGSKGAPTSAAFKQAAKTGATTVATACNFCNIMMEDGMKVTGNDEKMKVMDIAELVSKSL